MIKSFADSETAAVFHGRRSRHLPHDIQQRARRKLRMIHQSIDVVDLRIPRGNALEKLSGDREGQWSIRINRQWRICFIWDDGDAYQVEITDYH